MLCTCRKTDCRMYEYRKTEFWRKHINRDKDIKNILIHHIGMRSEINSSMQRNLGHHTLLHILCQFPQAFPGEGGGNRQEKSFFQIHSYSSFLNVVQMHFNAIWADRRGYFILQNNYFEQKDRYCIKQCFKFSNNCNIVLLDICPIILRLT